MTDLIVGLPIVKWLVRHAAVLLTRYQVGHDGQTAWRRLTGKPLNCNVVHFGVCVMGRLLALKKPSSVRKASRGKKLLAVRSLPGVWLGIYPRTGEHIVALETGEAIRVRTVHRLPEPYLWNVEALAAVRALPRKPGPVATAEEPSPRRNNEDESSEV